ncbi:MAG: AAA family ATPase [Kiritimatiellae bacterium]|nr:AAA family ATPase [Kiritimatiellia bacterium]
MRIQSIVIENYRQYRSLRLDLEKPNKDGYDLNVLVGKNGFGKTNLANAFCWCLWEKEPDLALKDKNAGKPLYNVLAMNECKASGKKYLEVSVSVKIDLEDSKGRCLLVQRKCMCNTHGLIDEPRLIVAVTQRSSQKAGMTYDGQDAQDEIERYYPSDLSDYLVFDGERLTTYFQRGQAAKIEQSVINLSGVQKLDEAMHHHQVIMNDLDGQIKDNSVELQAAAAKREKAVAEYNRNCTAILDYEREVEDAESRIQHLRESIGNHKNVPELLSKKDGYEAALKALDQKMLEVHAKKCELIRTYYPVLVVMKYAPTLHSYIEQKQARQEYPPSIKKEIFEEILKVGKCMVCGEKLTPESIQYVKDQIDKYNKTVVSTETYKAINNRIEPQIYRFSEKLNTYLDKRDWILQSEANIAKQQEETEERLQEVRDKLATVNNALNYKSMIAELNERESSQRYSRDMLGAAREKASRLLSEKQAAEAEYERIRLQSDNDESRRNQRRVVLTSMRIVSMVRKNMVDEIRTSIEEKANKYWHSLMWKPADEIGTIRFSAIFEVTLADESGQQLIGTLSAAEREMLALSITWAIHSQAGINFPFFIDTPVANMSSDSRRDFAVTLKDIAKEKQVVLLFTDTEYVNEIPEAFGNDLNMLKTLSYSKGVTVIR